MEQQDQHIVKWMLASMSAEFTNRVVGCYYAYQVWDKAQVYFASRTRAKVSQPQTRLKSIQNEGSGSEYLLKIKKIVYSLCYCCIYDGEVEIEILPLD